MSIFIKTAVILKNENKFLLVQENGTRVQGLWNWPQGKVEEHESIEQAAIREVKEETGLTIRIQRKISILLETFPDTKELHVYLGIIESGAISFPKNEIMDVQFFNFEEIEQMKEKLVGPWIYDLIIKNK